MRIILFVLFLEVIGFALSPKSCYTVQVISADNNTKNYQRLASKEYDPSCKIMDIGSMLTVRCGCFDKYRDVKQHLHKIKQTYKDATIATTYKSRFADHSTKKQPSHSLSKKKVVQKEKSETIDIGLSDASVITPVITTTSLKTVSDTATITDYKYKKKNKKKKKHKKKKKKKKKKNKKKKTKKADKTKIVKKKYVKKKSQDFFYDRYIKKLKHEDKGIGRFDYRYAFGAQISYDVAYISEAERSYDDRGLRRFRVWHDGSFYDKKLFYELEYSFTGNSHYKDLFIGYKEKVGSLDGSLRVKMGNIKIPFSLERYTSSKYNTFMERSLNDAFSLSRKVGAEILYSQKFDSMRLNFFGAYFTNSIDERIDDEINKPGFSSRITLAQKLNKREILHFGLGLRIQDYKGENIRIKQGAESDWIDNKYVSTKIKDADSVISKNIEAMYIYNRYYIQSEYTMQSVEARKGHYDFYAFYVQGSYFLLGSGKRFKMSTSTLSKIKPKKDGALEIAARYAYINLNDKDEHGGEQQDLTLGLNWYIDDKLRVSGNYILANPKETDDYDGVFQIWQARILFFF